MVYAAGSLALAALELLVHVDKDMVPSDLVQIEIDVPDTLKIRALRVKHLPSDWRSYPAPATLQRLGDDWLGGQTTAVLRVPSAVIPEAFNFILNPQHPEAKKIRVVGTKRFAYDPRLSS